MKPEDDFDVQTKFPVSETPDPTAKKLPVLPVKKIFYGLAFIFAGYLGYFGYNFNNQQQKAIAEYRENNEKIKAEEEKEKLKTPEDIKAEVEALKDWGKIFNTRKDYANSLNFVLGSYLTSLNLPEFEGLHKNYEPKIFQIAQKDFLEIVEKYKKFEDPDFSQSKGNEESFKTLNESGRKEVEYLLPLLNFMFEKASNSKEAVTILKAIAIQKPKEGKELTENQTQLLVEACSIKKEKIPAFKGLSNC